MIDFAGWDMPVQYTSILDEHKAVRTACGVFDISHMGEFFVRGAGVAAWLDFLLTNRVVALEAGQSQYSLMLNERGGVIDDLIVYRIKEMEFLIVVNASKIEEDAAWLQAHLTEGIVFEDRSDDFAALAVQGPDAPKVFEACFGRPLPAERNRVIEIGSNFVVTTGYTGEVGFEIISPAAEVGALWDGFLAAGVKPCGLGARDTLRLEMCYPLNGSDLSLEHTPLEAGLGFFVNLEKGEFIGREILANQRAAGLSQRLVAIKMDEKSPPIRSHYPVLAEGQKVAETTSGALSPSLGYGIAMAYLPFALAKVGQPLEIQVRDRSYKASVVKKPFYQAK